MSQSPTCVSPSPMWVSQRPKRVSQKPMICFLRAACRLFKVPVVSLEGAVFCHLDSATKYAIVDVFFCCGLFLWVILEVMCFSQVVSLVSLQAHGVKGHITRTSPKGHSLPPEGPQAAWAPLALGPLGPFLGCWNEPLDFLGKFLLSIFKNFGSWLFRLDSRG